MSYMTIEALYAVDYLRGQGICCDLIDLRSVHPIDWATLNDSVQRTGCLLVLDPGNLNGSISGEIVARVTADAWDVLRCAPQRLAMPDCPEASSPALTERYHVRGEHIARKICTMLARDVDVAALALPPTHAYDVPGEWFSGPF